MNNVIFPRVLKQSALIFTLLSSSWLLTACGGNGANNTVNNSSSSTSSHVFSSTSTTPSGNGTWPDVKISASGTKTLKFEWTAPPSGASYYKLFKKADSASNFQQVGSNFTTTSISDAVNVHLADWVNSRYKVQACSDTGCIDSTVIVTDSAMLSAITYIKASNTEANDWFGWSIAISGDGKTLAVGAPAEASNAISVNGDQTSNTTPNAGAVYVFTKNDSNWQQQAYLKASNTEQPNTAPNQTQQINDRFGYQIAISSDGNTLAVSAIMEDSLSIGINCDEDDYEYTATSQNSSNSSLSFQKHLQTDRGAVYIFKRSDNVWAKQAYIKSFSNVAELNVSQFGNILALSGDGKHLAIGIPQDSITLNGVFMREKKSSSSECVNFNASQSSLSSTSTSNSSNNTSNSSSSTSSNTSNSSLPGGINSGAVYLYKFDDLGWAEDAYIKASDAEINDLFGTSISFSQDGTLLAIGASGEEGKDAADLKEMITLETVSSPLNSGAVYMFQHTNDVWLEQPKIKPSHNGWEQSFGTNVALSGDGSTLAVGAPGDWSKAQGINGDPTDYVPSALVSVDQNTVYHITPKSGSSYASGAIYIFKKTSTTWNENAYLKASNSQPSFHFGEQIALSYEGNVLAAGVWVESSLAKGINGDSLDKSSSISGAAYVFKLIGNDWIQKSYIKAPNNDANDRFGRALGLDANGDNLVIGAYRESSNAKGINGNKDDNSAPASGAVYIY